MSVRRIRTAEFQDKLLNHFREVAKMVERRLLQRGGKPQGMNYADVLARKRMIRQAVQDEVILHEVNISMQRHLWLTAVALHEAYGFSEKRLDKFFDAFQAAADELQKMIDEVDQDYAYEKLRLRAEDISKRKITFYEDMLK